MESSEYLRERVSEQKMGTQGERELVWNIGDDELVCDHILASIEIEHWKNVRNWIASTFYWEWLSLADISSCSSTNPIPHCVHGIPFNWIGFGILWQRIVTSPVIVSCRILNYMCSVRTRPFTCSDVCHCMCNVHRASCKSNYGEKQILNFHGFDWMIQPQTILLRR